MKVELQVPAPFPELLRQHAPEGVQVSFAPFVEGRSGGIHDINWIQVTVSAAAGYALPKVLDFIGGTLKKIPAKIKTENGFEEFAPEIVEKLLKTESETSRTSESK